MKRRDFISNSALAMASLSFTKFEAFSQKNSDLLLSLQLYSVRDEMKKNPSQTIKALAEIGYKDCEHAGYDGAKRQFYGMSVSDYKKLLQDNGMTMQSGHTVFGKMHWDGSKFTDLWKTTVEDAVTVGQKYIISPWLDISYRKNFDDLKQFMEVFNKCGEYCKSNGIMFGYHNHDFEFSLKLTSKRVYDIMLENTDPMLVKQQLDIGNMYGGGGRAEELLKQYPGRFELMHVKDEIKGEKEPWESAVLGTGVIGVKEIVKQGVKKGGTKYLIVEQESYQGKLPIDAMKQNFDIMKKWGY